MNRIMPAHAIKRQARIRDDSRLTIPTKTYGCEVWAIRKNDKQRITTAEMRFMRRSAGYTLLNKKRNDNIIEELLVTSCHEKY